MVPASFSNYLVAMAMVDAALIGLLFAALSINLEHTLSRRASGS